MNRKTLIISLISLALLLSACGGGVPPHIAERFGTATPTPFMPAAAIGDLPEDKGAPVVPLTSADPEGNTAPWGNYPAPSEDSDIAIPPPMGLFEQPEGQVNILIMGSDQRPEGGGFRTDVILLLTLNRKDGSANLTSFPRDLYVYQPGRRMDRINSAQALGGFDLMALTFEYNFGVRPDYWVLINFDGFKGVIDSLGGIEVQVEKGLSDQREGYGSYSVGPGTRYMDGETALWYVRSRSTTSDFDRTRRQQEVLQAIFQRSLSLGMLPKAPELYSSYKQAVSTNIGFTDILPLLPLAAQIGNNGNMSRYAIGPDQVSHMRTSAGAAVLLPDQEAMRLVLAEALNSPPNP